MVVAHEMPEFSRYDSKQPYSVIRYPMPGRLSSVCIGYHLLKQIIKKKPDIIFLGHVFGTRGLAVLLTKWLLRIPYVILIHNGLLPLAHVNNINHLAIFSLLRHANSLIVNSKYTGHLIQEQGFLITYILYPGVDINRFHQGINTSNIASRYHLAGKKVILSVARLVERKGHEQVLRALPEVIKKIPNVVFLIAGRGEQEAYLRKIASVLGIESRVIFTGYVDDADLPALYCASDIFLMPSVIIDRNQDCEGFGIVFSEANACGLPVIGGKSGGMEDAVIDGETGFLVNPNNLNELASLIIRLLTDVKLSLYLGTKGRRRVERELVWDKVCERLEKLLISVVNAF